MFVVGPVARVAVGRKAALQLSNETGNKFEEKKVLKSCPTLWLISK